MLAKAVSRFCFCFSGTRLRHHLDQMADNLRFSHRRLRCEAGCTLVQQWRAGERALALRLAETTGPAKC